MSSSSYYWFKVAHLVGMVFWIGGLVGLVSLLRVAKGQGNEIVATARRVAVLADAGATLAIAMGFAMAFDSARWGNGNAFGSGGWLHIKLTAIVLGILSVHGIARARLKRLRNGQAAGAPDWLQPIMLAAAAVAITLAANPTLLRN